MMIERTNRNTDHGRKSSRKMYNTKPPTVSLNKISADANDFKQENSPENSLATNKLKKPTLLTDKIDFAALILYLFFYILFNGVYVAKYI